MKEELQDHLPLCCEDCEKSLLVFVNDLESHFVICRECGAESSLVFCPHCQIGGSFVSDIVTRPTTWECPQCHRSYPLSASFYEEPVFAYWEKDIPDEFFVPSGPIELLIGPDSSSPPQVAKPSLPIVVVLVIMLVLGALALYWALQH